MTASGVSWSDLTSYVPFLTDGGVAGVWIAAWIKGWVVAGRELERVSGDRDQWKDLYMRECEAHERTRDALRLASERGESTVEALQLVAGVMNAVRAQAGHEDLPEAQHAQASRGNHTGTRSHREVSPPGRRRPGDAKQ